MPIDYAEKYDVAAEMESSILGKAKNFTVATLADIGTTLWNSLPFLPEASTEDVLSKIDQDALSFYSENPNAVQLTSLVAGSLVPGGVALKLLSRARAGVASMEFANSSFVGGAFAGSRQKLLTTEIENAFRAAGTGSKEYNSLKRQLYAANATQQILDNAVIELAVVGAMNAHPYMQDYTASTSDFLKNFSIGASVGGVLGGLFSIPASTRLLRDTVGKIEVEAAANVLESGFKPVPLGMTSAARVQLHTENINILEGLLAKSETEDYLKTMMSNILAQETKQLDDVVTAAMPKTSRIDEATLKQITRSILSKPELEGVDKIKLINMDKVEKTTSKLILSKLLDPSFVDADEKAVLAFYRPSTGEVFDFKGAKNAALAADVQNASTKIRILAKEYKNQYGRPNTDFEDDVFLRTSSSAQLDMRYLAEMNAVDTLNLDQLRNVVVGPRDLSRMHALVSKIQKLSPEERAGIKLLVTNDQPSYARQQTVIKKIIEDEKLVSPTYLDDISRLQRSTPYALNNGQLSESARELVSFWISGTHRGKRASIEFPLTATSKGYGDPDNQIGIQAFRILYNNVTQGGAIPKGMEKWVPAMKEIIAEGQKLQPELRKLADSEGYIYLYRGSSGKVQGSNVSSYSWSRDRANNFGTGTPFLARVHVEDVVGVLNSEDEFIVRAHTPTMVEGIPTQPKSQMSTHVEHLIDDANAAEGRRQITLDELPNVYFREVFDMASDMLKKGFSVEETSARLNLTKEGVLSVMMGDADSINWGAFRYTDAAKTGEYIDVQNNLFAISGNPQRYSMASAVSGLDRRQARLANKQMVEDFTLQSDSVIANRVLGIYANEGAQAVVDKVVDQLATVVNSMTGNFRWQSADQMLRALEIGPIVTGLGKRFIDTTDALRKEILEPLATSFQSFRDDPAALIEFNSVMNTLAGMKGWRELAKEPHGNDWVILQKQISGGKTQLIPHTNPDGSVFKIKQEAVKNALEATRAVSDEILKLHNLNRTITGNGPISDLGFYTPPVSLVGKSYSFVVDKTGQKPVQLLVANSADELVSLEQAWKSANAADIARYQLFSKGEQREYSALNEYMAVDTHVTYANVAYQHKGRTGQPILPSDFRMVENIVNSYENLILQGARRYHESYLHDAMYWLDEMSNFYQRATLDQPKRGLAKESVKNAPLSVKNILLGRDQLEQSVGLKATNSFYDMMLNKAVTAIDNHIKAPTQLKRATKDFYDDLVKKLAAEGVDNPWKSFDEYLATVSSDARNVSAAVQSAGNGLLATMNLRMFEVAQAAVNIMSLPILSWAALMERLPGTKLNDAGMSMKFPLRIMYDGIRHMNSADGKRLSELWESQGLINQATRQFTETTADLKSAYRGGRFSDKALAIANGLQENKIVKDFLSKPADWAENMTRKIAMHVGYQAAKHAYPGIDDFGASIAAMNFMDRTIGNYHAAQRPGFFQGTFGAAIGLYQTYMVTYAQSIYRGLENRNFKQLAAQMLAQAGVFGISSMPGYNLLSEHVIANFNDSHWDITSGTYRAVGDSMAEVILYGLPSSLGPALYTRGDVSPRVPTSFGDIAMYNGIRQGWDAAATFVQKTAEGLKNGNLAQSMTEALSLQSLNRPIARWAELISGESITRQGNTVSPSSEVWTPVGIFSRVIGTRPLEEQVVRNTVYKNKFYEALDFERRQEAVASLKSALRAGNLTDSLLSETALKYLRAGGSSKGWTSAMNELLLKTEQGARWDLLAKLEPRSPLRAMIDDMY